MIQTGDMFPAMLCGIQDVDRLPRSIAVTGPKWMWNPTTGGLPPQDFLTAVDPLLAGVRDKLKGRHLKSNEIAGRRNLCVPGGGHVSDG